MTRPRNAIVGLWYGLLLSAALIAVIALIVWIGESLT